MIGVRYDLDIAGVRGVLQGAAPEASNIAEEGNQAVSAGESILSQCGTAVSVTSAFSKIWQSRSETGSRAAVYSW